MLSYEIRCRNDVAYLEYDFLGTITSQRFNVPNSDYRHFTSLVPSYDFMSHKSLFIIELKFNI